MQFGYLSLSDMETQQVRSLEEVRAAVRRLQRQAGLPPTGAFDSATERLMKTRRCGVQDLSAPALARSAGPESFTLNSGQWPHTAITYRYIALYAVAYELLFSRESVLHGRGPMPPNKIGPPIKPFIFYFSLTIDAYETTT